MRCFAILGFFFAVVLAAIPTVSKAQTGPDATATPTPPFVVGKTHFFVVDDGTAIVPSPASVPPGSSAPASTPTPLDSNIGSYTAAAASGIIAAELTKRGLFAHTDYATFWRECQSTENLSTPDLTRAVQFHFIVTGISNTLQQNQYLGTTWTNMAIAWSVYDCRGKEILASNAESVWESHLYHRYSWRIPLAQILALVQLTNVLHTNTIHAPLIAGFSAGAGSVNTYLDQAISQDQIIERTFFAGASRLAADFCGRAYPGSPKGLHCWATTH